MAELVVKFFSFSKIFDYLVKESVKSLSRVWLCDPIDGGPTKLLHLWDFPGKNTGVGCHFLLQEIFLTQGLNLGVLHCRQMLYRLSHQGSKYVVNMLPRYICAVKNQVKNPASTGDPGSMPGSDRSPAAGNGNPLRYSCLENAMDRGVWQGYSPWGYRVGHDWATEHSSTWG